MASLSRQPPPQLEQQQHRQQQQHDQQQHRQQQHHQQQQHDQQQQIQPPFPLASRQDQEQKTSDLAPGPSSVSKTSPSVRPATATAASLSSSASAFVSAPASAFAPAASSSAFASAGSRRRHKHHRHQPASSVTGSFSLSRSQRSASGFLGRAAAAIDRSQGSSRANRNSVINLVRVASETDALPPSPGYSSPRLTFSKATGIAPERESLPERALRDPPSTRYTDTDPNLPRPVFRQSLLDSKMHQTSSRLLRMTDDERPFTRDFKDLFATLIVSLLPLSAHRVRLTRVEHTFLSEDAINNLGSLKFSQSNRMPDPKDPSRIVTTTTTTTFSMAKDMARAICQRFLEARFLESADGKYQQVYTMKGSVWQLTPKGITVLDRFCARNGIQQKQVAELAANAITNLVLLERDPNTDKLVTDQGTMEVIFRRFIGVNGRNIKPSVSSADSDSLSDYRDGLTGVKMAAERKVAGKLVKDTFTGRAATDWLMDCSTTVDRRETVEIGSLFVEYGLMEALAKDKTYVAHNPDHESFQPTKNALYQMTARGRDLINGVGSRGRSSESEGAAAASAGGAAAAGRSPAVRDSNTQRLEKILTDAALRLLFRENLRDTHCEENLSFYIDVEEFVRSCRAGVRTAQKSPSANSMDTIKEIMAQAYGIYNAFLAPGSPCELNIDHQLRSNLATRMTKAVGQDVAMIDTLEEVTTLFEDAQIAVFKLMASDSVPKFLKSAKYEQVLKNYDLDSGPSTSMPRVPERSQSRSARNQ